jgi:anti-sigma B factor antagonist
VDDRASILRVEPHGRYAVGRVLCPSVSQRESQVIETELSAAGPGATWKLVLDCRDVGMLSSVGLGMLITMHKKCSDGKGKFAIFGLSKDINDLLKITKLDKLIHVTVDEAAAIAKVGGK